MTAMPGTLPDLLDQLAAALERNAAQSVDQGRDQAVALVRGRLLQTIGTLHLYEFFLPPEVRISADLAASLLLGEETEPTEGLVLFQEGERLVLQVFDAIGEVVPHATLVPDSSGLALTISRRLAEMSKAGTSYTLGPAERLLPIIEAGQSGDRATLAAVTPTSVLTPLWQEDEAARRQKVATLVVELIRANKRILLVTPDHQSADLITLVVARVMKAAGLTFKSWLSRYEVATSKETGGIPCRIWDLRRKCISSMPNPGRTRRRSVRSTIDFANSPRSSPIRPKSKKTWMKCASWNGAWSRS